MNRIKKIIAVTALLCIVLSGCEHAASGQLGSQQTSSKSEKVTLVYLDGTEKDYTLDEMRSELNGTTVLLRDSCMDDDAGCDMKIVYDAMDFAVINGAVNVEVPLTKTQYNTIKDVWLQNDFFEQLYPTVNQNSFSVTPSSDDRYLISFEFNSFSDKSGEAAANKLITARDKAIEIVSDMPQSCDNDYKKAEYLYNYLTTYVTYFEGGQETDRYWEDICLLYDALIKNETVCAGYAYSFAYLCELAGIDAQYVTTWTGNENDPSHEVVIAEIDGENCWFDATWDYGKNRSGFDYFGLSDTEFENKHQYNKTYYDRDIYPTCRSSLEKPTGYWDFDTMEYRSYDAGISVIAGRYSITTALDNKMVLEVDGYSKENGGNVQIYENGFIDFQKFDVSKDDSGYIFRNCGSSLVVDVQGGYTSSGTNVWQFESNSSAAQRWSIINAGDGYYYIKSSLGDLYLEVEGSSTSNCTNVQVASYTGKSNQKWRFDPAN